MNDLNQKIYDLCPFHAGPVYADDWITSKTTLNTENYSNAPKAFTINLGISEAEWNKVSNIYVLRSCVLTPFLAKHITYDKYWNNFMKTMRRKIAEITTSAKMYKAA